MSEKAIPFSEIKSVKQLFEEPEVQSMGITEKVETTKYATKDSSYLEFPRNPIHYSKSETAEMAEPPLLGEHTS